MRTSKHHLSTLRCHLRYLSLHAALASSSMWILQGARIKAYDNFIIHDKITFIYSNYLNWSAHYYRAVSIDKYLMKNNLTSVFHYVADY